VPLNEYEFPTSKISNVQSQLEMLVEKNYYLHRSAKVSRARQMEGTSLSSFFPCFWTHICFLFNRMVTEPTCRPMPRIHTKMWAHSLRFFLFLNFSFSLSLFLSFPVCKIFDVNALDLGKVAKGFGFGVPPNVNLSLSRKESSSKNAKNLNHGNLTLSFSPSWRMQACTARRKGWSRHAEAVGALGLATGHQPRRSSTARAAARPATLGSFRDDGCVVDSRCRVCLRGVIHDVQMPLSKNNQRYFDDLEHQRVLMSYLGFFIERFTTAARELI
jgi:hypothetical protein